jgi:hypothetical protein
MVTNLYDGRRRHILNSTGDLETVRISAKRYRIVTFSSSI